MIATFVLAPAGSGKTKRLAHNYIELLKRGVKLEKILAITFTEKAAYEMKERIFNLTREEEPNLFQYLKEHINRVRILTIDAFCLSLIRRFAFLLGLSNYVDVVEDLTNLEEEAINEAIFEIIQERKKDEGLYEALLQFLTEHGFNGFSCLKSNFLKPFFKQRIFTERVDLTKLNQIYLNLKEKLSKSENEETALQVKSRLLGNIALRFFLEKVALSYFKNKLKREVVDFADLELFAYKLLSAHPEFSNILDAFDERTDHILVDEFQDTNFLQWAIIDKLTEEWRAGMGRKSALGINPSLFLVGDEKQSIYYFRGANVEVVSYAKEKLKNWLDVDFRPISVEDNFRSLSAIIDFTNFLFARLFDEYQPFFCRRKNDSRGKVEIIVAFSDLKTEERRELECSLIAKRIKSIVNNLEIFRLGSEEKYRCDYRDIAILIRRRTYLRSLETALRSYQIPFVVVKGTGFYSEPEIELLLSLLKFLYEPTSSFHLYLLLKSPLFSFSEKEIIAINQEPGASLFEKMIKYRNFASEKRKADIDYLLHLTKLEKKQRLSLIIEEVLRERETWRYLSEPQRKANVKKFLMLLEKLESENRSILEIEQFFLYKKEDEPKANINTEEMNAVKIMTIHEAKGLQFPVVFLPHLDEKVEPAFSEYVLFKEKEDGEVLYFSEGLRALREKNEYFLEHKRKQIEEEKRLFYVGITRATDALFLSGVRSPKIKESRLLWLFEILGIRNEGKELKAEVEIDGLEILGEEAVEKIYQTVPKKEPEIAPPVELPQLKKILELKEGLKYVEVTKILPAERKRHSLQWVIFGEVLHIIFDEISKGYLPLEENKIKERSRELFREKGMPRKEINEWQEEVIKHYIKLKEHNLLKIIEKRENSYSELPFILKYKNRLFAGRIDRVIKEEKKFFLYDYKTFPLPSKDVNRVALGYKNQLRIYELALKQIFGPVEVVKNIVFTSLGIVVPVG